MHTTSLSTRARVKPRTCGVRLADLVLTRDPKQRRCIMVQLLTALLMAVCIGAMTFAADYGMADGRQVLLLATLCAISSTTFFVLIRSSINQRCKDPTLAFPQTIVAQTLIAIGYAIGGPFHAVGLLMFALVMVFGMFSMRGAAVLLSCLYTVVILAAVMAWRVRTDPVHYLVHIELIYFVLLATVLPAISGLSRNLMEMRLRLKNQKQALQIALERIQDMATRDELTGLPNRRFMMAQLQEHALRRSRGGLPFYIGMVDLDHFKSVNDTYGHAVGDDVLRAFGIQARTALRTTDLIGRWGGEEFLLVLPETHPGEPTVALARLRTNLGDAEVSASEPHLRVAFSSGYTRYVEGEPIGQAIERADRALYAAKSAGRNQSVMI
ncbi:MAG: GGDEF domain-containing protein [Pseudomonadota bacterium]|nr:GGDEF domain-containing protein [Pseudomonadota bacterium]